MREALLHWTDTLSGKQVTKRKEEALCCDRIRGLDGQGFENGARVVTRTFNLEQVDETGNDVVASFVYEQKREVKLH